MSFICIYTFSIRLTTQMSKNPSADSNVITFSTNSLFLSTLPTKIKKTTKHVDIFVSVNKITLNPKLGLKK